MSFPRDMTPEEIQEQIDKTEALMKLNDRIESAMKGAWMFGFFCGMGMSIAIAFGFTHWMPK